MVEWKLLGSGMGRLLHFEIHFETGRVERTPGQVVAHRGCCGGRPRRSHASVDVRRDAHVVTRPEAFLTRPVALAPVNQFGGKSN